MEVTYFDAEVSTLQTSLEVDIGSIWPSPENDEIYRAADPRDPELVDLANSISRDGMLEPIVITQDRFIVSGHRRYAAAKLIELVEVPVTVLDVERSAMTEHEYKKLILRYNYQRHKNSAERLKEKLLAVDPDIAHEQLIAAREARDERFPAGMLITGTKTRSAISSVKLPMLNACLEIIDSLRRYWPLNIRQVHYQLLNDPPLRNKSKPKSVYANDRKSYQDLSDLLTRARLAGDVPWNAIEDQTRPTTSTQFDRDIAEFIDIELHNLFRGYRRDLMQSQLDHIEIVAEKLTVQNILRPVANRYCIPLTIGRGYCSLDPRKQIADRYRQSAKDRLVLLILSDFDPDGMEICESFARSMRDDFSIDQIVAHKVLLTSEQVKNWRLPPNGLEAKEGSANYEKFIERFGSDKVFELEAIKPAKMAETLASAIDSVIDVNAFNRELAQEKRDAATLSGLKAYITEKISDLPDLSGNGFKDGGRCDG